MRARDERTVLTQRDADRRLGERLHDVTFWRSELQVIIFISYLSVDIIKAPYLNIHFILLILKYTISFQSELERNLNETHHLMETRKSLERSLAETEGPMRVTSECIYHREGRKGIDLVNDAPENSLMREVDTIKSCQDKMRQTLEQVGFDSHYICIIGQ